jgi:hypothetical protein
VSACGLSVCEWMCRGGADGVGRVRGVRACVGGCVGGRIVVGYESLLLCGGVTTPGVPPGQLSRTPVPITGRHRKYHSPVTIADRTCTSFPQVHVPSEL